MADAPQIINSTGKPKVILRHDIDINLNKAVRLAAIDMESGVRACYMIMVNSPLYIVEGPEARSRLKQIARMGHEIALHFDFDRRDENTGKLPMEIVEDLIRKSCRRLEDASGVAVRSISFHRPMPEFLGGPLIVAGRVNAYAKELMAWYLSDSKGAWREGEPLPKLFNPAGPLLQLLTHPIWWGETHQAAQDRLQVFYDEMTRNRPGEWSKTFDDSLAGHITVQRRKRTISTKENSR